MALPSGIPPHQLEALARGESILFKGEQILPDKLPSRVDLITGQSDEIEQFKSEIEQLRLQLAEKSDEIEVLKGLPVETGRADGSALALTDLVLEASNTALNRLPETALQMMAKLKGHADAPDTKPELLALLKPEGE